jgi:sugar-specific transcriptional regulator TrmB
MRIPNSELLEEIGLTLYERKALAAVMVLGVADAASICRHGAIPTSKIYRAMERLAHLGLAQVQPTRPKMYAALPVSAVVERVVTLVRERADRLSAGGEELQRFLTSLTGTVRGRHPFVDLALGAESHVKRHLVQLADANDRILSYMEHGDLAAIDQAIEVGFPILRRIARNAAERKVLHQVVFGFSYRTAPQLLEFLKRHRADIRHLTGIRYSGEVGHPFHVVDDRVVILPLDHPFIPGGRFASLLIRDEELAANLANGFEKLWRKAMRSLQEINADPRRRSSP